MIDIIIAVVIDFIVGDPEWLPHPIRLFGFIIKHEEKFIRKFFKGKNGLKFGGGCIVIANILLVFFVTFFILKLLKGQAQVYHIVDVYLIYTTLAAKCLRNEAMKIYKALSISIAEARFKLSYIVGRDTKELEAIEIVRATVETVAENTSDGIIAPLLFAIIGGAPLACVYKMVNTMDSMLGYMNEKYRNIGYFPAKTDDVFNYVPARVTGILMNVSSFIKYDGPRGFKIMFRDRKNHKSPNCAYPEGAVAGLLGVQLGGDNFYFGEIMKKPRIGDPVRKLESNDIKKTIEIMFRSEILLIIIYVLVKELV